MAGLETASRNATPLDGRVISIAPSETYRKTPEFDNASAENDDAPLDFSIRRSISLDSDRSDMSSQPTDFSANFIKQEGEASSRNEISPGSMFHAFSNANQLPENRLNLLNGTMLGLPTSASLLPNSVFGTLAMQAQSQQPLFSLLQSAQFQSQLAAGQVTNIGQSNEAKTKRKPNVTKVKRSDVLPLAPIAPFPVNLPEVAAINACSQEAYKKFRELMSTSREVAQSESVASKSRIQFRSESASPESSQSSMSPPASRGDGASVRLPPSQLGGGGGGVSTTTAVTSTSGTKLKRAVSVGGSGQTMEYSSKDDAYWERRRRNNDAAKRSRDARRQKEDEIAVRAAFLEQENVRLRIEVAALRSETARLRMLLHDKGNDGGLDNNVDISC